LIGACEYGNELPASIKGGEFLDWLSDCQLLEKDSLPWSYLVGSEVWVKNYNSISKIQAVKIEFLSIKG
jgi:hypothetical protein